MNNRAYRKKNSICYTVSLNEKHIGDELKAYAQSKGMTLEQLEESFPVVPNILCKNFIQIPQDNMIHIYTNDCNRIKYLTHTEERNFTNRMLNHLKYTLKLDDRLLDDPIAFREFADTCIIQNVIPVAKEYSKIANKDSEYGLAYYNLDALTEAPTIAWDSFIGQVVPEYREIFMAWLYGLFLRDNRCRQVCWLHGAGKSGKTTVANVISEILRQSHPDLVSTLEHRFYCDKFTMASFESSILIIVSDSKERRLIASDMVKSITGGDNATIRGMSKAKKSAQIYSKILVTSNYMPSVDVKQVHELSRILYIPIDAALSQKVVADWNPKLDWTQCLTNEFWYFIAKCKKYYYKHINDDRHNINPPESMVDLLSNSTFGKINLDAESFLAYNTVLSPNDYILLSELEEKFATFLAVKSNWRTKSNLYHRLMDKNLVVTFIGIGSEQIVRGIKWSDTFQTRKHLTEVYKNTQ